MSSLVRGQFFCLYLVGDVWSRKFLGWDVHEPEASEASDNMLGEAKMGTPRKDPELGEIGAATPLVPDALCAFDVLGIGERARTVFREERSSAPCEPM